MKTNGFMYQLHSQLTLWHCKICNGYITHLIYNTFIHFVSAKYEELNVFSLVHFILWCLRIENMPTFTFLQKICFAVCHCSTWIKTCCESSCFYLHLETKGRLQLTIILKITSWEKNQHMFLHYRKYTPNVTLYLNLKSGQTVGRQLHQTIFKEGRFFMTDNSWSYNSICSWLYFTCNY